jgi:hypothetical protein
VKSIAIIMFLVAGLVVFSPISAQTQAPQETRYADIVILKDESGSMNNKDPHDLRDLVVYTLANELELSPEGNRVSLVLYGASALRTVDLTQGYQEFRLPEKLHFDENQDFKDKYSSIEETPPRALTDFYLALREAGKILEAGGGGGERDKYVLLLTDGELHPYPGHERFEKVARQYVEQLGELAWGQRYDFTAKYSRDFCVEPDTRRIFEEVIPRYRKNGWKIFVIGFSDGIKRDFLKKLASSTNGSHGFAHDADAMAGLLDEMLPVFQNVIRFRDRDFCEEGKRKQYVEIQTVKAVTFRIQFSRGRGHSTLPLANQVEVQIRRPDGTILAKSDPAFRTYLNKKKQVLEMSAFIQSPPTGQWQVEIIGNGYDPCGKLRISAYRPQDLEVRVEPEMDRYSPGASVNLNVQLVADGNPVPLSSARADLLRPGEDEALASPQLASQGGEIFSGVLTLPEEDGQYLLRVTVRDKLTGAIVTTEKELPVLEMPCNPKITPSRINLGAVGGRANQSKEVSVVLSLDCPKVVDVRVDLPELKNGGVRIPGHWIHVSPKQGTFDARTGDLQISAYITLPEVLPSQIKSGEYKGDLYVHSPSFEKGAIKIPVKVQLQLPELIISPEVLSGGFHWQLGRPQEQEITIKVKGKGTYPVNLRFSDQLYEEGLGSADVNFEILNENGQPVASDNPLSVSSNRPRKVVARAWVDDQFFLENGQIDPDLRVQAGLYTGEVTVFGDRLAEKTLLVEMEVPEITHWERVRAGFPVVPLVFLGLLVLALALAVYRKLVLAVTWKLEIEDGECASPMTIEFKNPGGPGNIAFKRPVKIMRGGLHVEGSDGMEVECLSGRCQVIATGDDGGQYLLKLKFGPLAWGGEATGIPSRVFSLLLKWLVSLIIIAGALAVLVLVGQYLISA